jgi:hypothetical protein
MELLGFEFTPWSIHNIRLGGTIGHITGGHVGHTVLGPPGDARRSSDVVGVESDSRPMASGRP